MAGVVPAFSKGLKNSSARASPTPASLSSISLRSLVVLVVLVLVVVRAVPRDDIGVRGDGGDGCGDGHRPRLAPRGEFEDCLLYTSDAADE